MRKSLVALFVLFLSISVLAACSDSSEAENSEEETEENTENTDNGWSVSPTFEVGQSEVRGKENRLAIDNIPFTAKENDTYVIYFWGEQEELMKGPVKIEAVHESTGDTEKAIVDYAGTEDEEKVWETGSPQVGGDQAHLTVNLSLPYEGLWRLDVFIADEKFDSIIVEVNEA